MSPLISQGSDPGKFIVVILVVFAAMIDQEIFFFINQLQNFASAGLKLRSQLNGKSRTRLLTKSSVDTPGKIDSKPSGVTAPVFSFRRLHGNATHGTSSRAEVTGDTPFPAIGVTGKDDYGT